MSSSAADPTMVSLKDLLKELGHTEAPDQFMYEKLREAETKGRITKRPHLQRNWVWISGSADHQTVKDMMNTYIKASKCTAATAEPTSSAATASGHNNPNAPINHSEGVQSLLNDFI